MIQKLLNFLWRLLGRKIATHAPDVAREIDKGIDATLPQPDQRTVPANQETRKKQNVARKAANPKNR